MTYTYTDDEITYPPGVTAKDMDWVLFTWDLRLPDVDAGNPRGWVRFVLAPGVLMIHTGSERDVRFPFTGPRIPGSLDISSQSSPIEVMMDAAIITTGFYLPDYEWMGEPMLLELNPDDYPEWSISYPVMDMNGNMHHEMIETLGDALVRNDARGASKDVLNEISSARRLEMMTKLRGGFPPHLMSKLVIEHTV